MSARLAKAKRNRAAELRPVKNGRRVIPKGRIQQSVLCRCVGCRCTTSIPIALGTSRLTRKEATCGPCRNRQHTHHDGSAFLRTRPDKRPLSERPSDISRATLEAGSQPSLGNLGDPQAAEGSAE